ncbi:hypothetical protein HGA13_15330 [Nocardia speluncae]|uniref:Secreted protein n=1 Tax=Nocardia speluncae TaxID=419477 RepID=A0A846XIL3_9NOCA|nr:hypothetical protein [Nocardia speluncae]NKY34433.1 hypothetical protein [Nocardia speluncae]
MKRVLVSGVFAAALTLGSVTGVAAAAPGLPLESAAPAVTDPQPVNAPSSGSGFMHEPSGSAFSGPVSSGSAEVFRNIVVPLVVTFSADPCTAGCLPL